MGVREALRGRVIDAYLSEGAVSLRRRVHRVTGAAKVELYFQVDDPYSYLLAERVGPIARSAELELEILLTPPPSADVDTEPELRLEWAMRDAAQLSRIYDLNFPAEPAAPTPPMIRRAQEILCKKRQPERQLSVIARLRNAMWSGDEEAVQAIADDAGAGVTGGLLERNARLRKRRGHYQGGMIRYGGEWYWGVDRLHHLCEHLREEGRDVPAPLLSRVADEDGPPVTRPEELEMFFSFRSPYSYVAAVRTVRLCEAHDIALRIRPVLPMVMRGHTVPLVKRLYIARDTAREARRYEVPFGNLCDPLGPGIERCLAVFYRAREQGKERDFVVSAGRGSWAEALDVASDDDMRVITDRAGLAWADVEDAMANTPWKEETEANREALYGLGLWGVPSFKFGELTVWGNDRLDVVERLIARTAPRASSDEG